MVLNGAVTVSAMIRRMSNDITTVPKLVAVQPEPWATCLKAALKEYQVQLDKFRPVREHGFHL